MISAISAFAQNMVTGVVTDAGNGSRLQYVMVYFTGTDIGTLTDSRGRFSLDNTGKHTQLSFELMGYETKVMTIDTMRTATMNISLRPGDMELNAAVIRSGRARYTKKGNPAVELMRKVMANRERNHPEGRDCYHVEEYDRLTLALNDYKTDSGKSRKLSFTKNFIDTSGLNGKPVLVLSVRERLSDTYYRKNPRALKKIVKAKRLKGYDEDLDVNGGLSADFETLFRSMDIYSPDMEIFTEHFTGPLAGELALNYYRYYISDTLSVNGTACTEISFVPANPESLGFTGKLYVAADSTYALRKAVIDTPSRINLNWIDDLHMEQEFSPLPDGSYATSKVETQFNMSLYGKNPSAYIRKVSTYRNYGFSIPEGIFDDGNVSGANSIDLPGANRKDEGYWDTHRHMELRRSESQVSELARKLRGVPFIDIATKVADVIATDFAPTRYPKEESRIDIGNVSNIIGKNEIEGWRFRIGAQTKAPLDSHFFVGGYLAYGTWDRQLKHSVKAVYSFNALRQHSEERPRNRIVLKHEYDLYSAEEQEFRDNIFFSVKTGRKTRYMQYINTSSLEYEKEWSSGLSLKGGVEYKIFKPAGDLSYTLASDPSTSLQSFSVMPFSLSLRYAPGEKIFGGTNAKRNINKNVPIFNLSHSFSPAGILGTDYGYNRTDFQFWKRTWIGPLGLVDTKVNAGVIWGQVPYPLLIIPATSKSIMYQKETFHLMKPFEFVCDRYLSLNLTYRTKGLIMNRIPLIKRLKMREYFTFDLIYGGLSDKNNPAICREGNFIMPVQTGALGPVPYMEVGAGIDNIFKLFHIIYIHRLTYLDTPDCEKNGVRMGIHLDF